MPCVSGCWGGEEWGYVVEEEGLLCLCETAESGTKFTFESNSDEQIKISVKTDSEEYDNDEALLRGRDDADVSRAEQEEESEAWGHKNSDGDRKSTYRMPTF